VFFTGFLFLSAGKIILSPLCMERARILPAQIMLNTKIMLEIPGVEKEKKSLESNCSSKRLPRKGILPIKAAIPSGEGLKTAKMKIAINNSMGVMESKNPYAQAAA